MKPGSHKRKPKCEMCGAKSVGKSHETIKNRLRYLCAAHLAVSDNRQRKTKPTLVNNQIFANEVISGIPEVDSIIFNRELSFSEKINLLNL